MLDQEMLLSEEVHCYGDAPCFISTSTTSVYSISVLKALGDHCSLGQLEIKNRDGRTPLQIAAFSSRNVECVQHFIDRGCDVNYKDCNECTPLAAAVCSGALASVKLLLKNGANPLLQLKNGGNVLQFAIEKNRRSIIKEFLALRTL